MISGLVAAALVAVLALLLPPAKAPSPASQKTPEAWDETGMPLPGMKLYANDAYGLRVAYPEEVIPVSDPKELAASGYIPVCDPETAVVCFPYGKEKYAGTNFDDAAFAVHDRKDLKDAEACGSVQPAEQAESGMVIGSTAFQTFSFATAATSHRLDGKNYRLFRDGRCLELSSRIATTVFEVWEPGSIQEFTQNDRADVQAVLDEILQSVRLEERPELL